MRRGPRLTGVQFVVDGRRCAVELVGHLAGDLLLSIPGSAAEVAAHPVADHLDLGLIQLPATDERIN
jgi:hypothetical protein